MRHTNLDWMKCCLWLLAMCFVTPGVWAQTAETMVVKRATELRGGPGDTTPSIGPLAAQATVTRLTARQGAWVEVKNAQGTTGWLHMFDLGSPAGAGGNFATGALRGVTNFFNRGGAGTGTASGQTSTVGIRGLGAEDLARSQPNLAAVMQAEGLRQNEAQARSFAADARLAPQAVEALPVPLPPNAGSGGGNNSGDRP